MKKHGIQQLLQLIKNDESITHISNAYVIRLLIMKIIITQLYNYNESSFSNNRYWRKIFSRI
jgi:hypothetical protein